MIRIALLLIMLLINLLDAKAQDDLYSKADTLPNILSDTIKIKQKKGFKNFLKKDYPSPKKAVLLAIVPGMGQIYNKKYWKLPLVYSALGGVIYSITFNSRQYNAFQNSLNIRADVDCENSTMQYTPLKCRDASEIAEIPSNAVEARRNSFDKNRQLSWIGLVGFYLISAGDAFVDAHLKDFNVNDDISFQPIFETGFNNQPIIGMGVRIPLGK
ncbi:MAG: DUF5683 domain-containing protein [Saprospiraceae bacterium]